MFPNIRADNDGTMTHMVLCTPSPFVPKFWGPMFQKSRVPSVQIHTKLQGLKCVKVGKSGGEERGNGSEVVIRLLSDGPRSTARNTLAN